MFNLIPNSNACIQQLFSLNLYWLTAVHCISFKKLFASLKPTTFCINFFHPALEELSASYRQNKSSFKSRILMLDSISKFVMHELYICGFINYQDFHVFKTVTYSNTYTC